jgi:hypothetical protein
VAGIADPGQTPAALLPAELGLRLVRQKTTAGITDPGYNRSADLEFIDGS